MSIPQDAIIAPRTLEGIRSLKIGTPILVQGGTLRYQSFEQRVEFGSKRAVIDLYGIFVPADRATGVTARFTVELDSHS